MRPFRLAVLTAALTGVGALSAAPALAEPGVALDPTQPFDVTYSATDNVEHLGRFPEHTGTASGAPSEDGTLFYLTDPRGVYVYDTTTPAEPRLLDSLPLYQTTTGIALAQEDVDTNGKILLVDAATSPASASSQLRIVDVSDPTNLTLLASVPVADHTWTCVSGTDATGAANTCAYAYGRTGNIVDLRDPAAPVLLPTTWRKAVGYGDRTNRPYTHDLTEIRPGLVMTAGESAILMDTRNPEAPVRLTAIEQPGRFGSLGYHSVEWARGGADRFLVLGTEIAPTPVPGLPSATANTAGSDCQGENSVIETWDARPVVEALEAYEAGAGVEVFEGNGFRKLDAYDAGERGLFVDGKSLGSQLYCAHWMELHPSFKKGGLMAVGYYDRGMRFVRVGDDGTMTEAGWFTPADGYVGSPQWISDDIVYSMDYRRGLEVLRITDVPPTKVVHRRNDVISPASTITVQGPRLPGGEIVSAAAALLVIGLVVVERTARRRTAKLA